MGWFRTTSSSGEGAAPVEDPLVGLGPGVPGRCPSCDGLGYIDNLDLGHRFQIQHCKDCGHRWEYLFDADGYVVGLTELDDEGQPVARMRVRNRPLVAERAPAGEAAAPEAPSPPPEPVLSEPALPEPALPEPVLPEPGASPEVVIDLRAPAPAPADADADADVAAPPEHMSPAEWLRHSLRR